MTELAARIVNPLRRSRIALALGILLALALAAAATLLVRTLMYRGDVLPGVRVLGVELDGLDRAGAASRSRTVVGERLRRPVTLLVGRQTVRLVPARVLAVRARETAALALAAGAGSFGSRAAALLSPVPPTHEVRPVLRVRRAEAAKLFAELRRLLPPPVDARVVMRGTTPVVTPARPGSRPFEARFLAALERRVVDGERTVGVYFRPAAPAVGDAAAQRAAAVAATIVSGPVRLAVQGRPAGTLGPRQLARLVRFRPAGNRYHVVVDGRELAGAVAPSVQRFERSPVDARFEVGGSGVRVVPARHGFRLDPAGAAAAVREAATRTERSAAIPMLLVEPERTTADAHALGIRERISSFTTDMGTSSANRIHNVHLMADFIDGTIIEPGQVFSFNRTVGPRTAGRGFREGQMIIGSLVLPAIGGGVCQTATTLFNNAFELGLPILERHNHGFYISHYPMGRDATVSWGGPDFVFKNDLDTGILISASYTDTTLTFAFWSTDPRRRVEASRSAPVNFRSPRMRYAIDYGAPRGSVRVVPGSQQRGFDVTVYRKVWEGRKLLRENTFTSSYIDVGPTTVYGPGKTPPGPYFVIPADA